MHLFSLGKGDLWNRQKSRQRTKNSVRISKRKSEEPPTTWQFISAKRVVAEIQQTSDVTYRIYDFKRKDKDGNYRQLHTKEAAECIDYTVLPDYRQHYTPAKNQGVSMVQCPYFNTAVYDLDEPMTLDYSELDSFVILIGLKGEAKITDNEGNEITLQGGESIVVPASTQTLKVEGTLKFLETYV